MLPILYQSHDLVLYSYPLLMGLAWGAGYQIFFSKMSLPAKYGQLLFWGLFFFSWVGSKLFFLLTTKNSQSLISEVSFWTGGGFVFYGGFLAGLLFLTIYKLLRFPLDLKALRSLLLALTVGHAIGRIGCLLAGCCYGSVTNFWWGIELHGAHRHPTQLLEALGLMILSYVLVKMRLTLNALLYYLVSYGLLRFGIEQLRGDEIRGLWGSFTPSQWGSLGLMCAGIFSYYYNKFKPLSFFQEK